MDRARYSTPSIAPHEPAFLGGRQPGAACSSSQLTSSVAGALIQLTRLDKPVGILLLLWPVLWALWIASQGQPDLQVMFIFVLGTVLMRSAGCAINDYADRHLDGQVQRTQGRPLATGALRPRTALLVAALLALCAFTLVWWLNPLTRWLSVIAVLLAAVYPFMKRYTYLPQVVLGAAFAWAVPMAFAAQTGAVPVVAWLLFTVTLLWTTAYDTVYAMVDRQDDLVAGIRSTAVLLGEADVPVIMMLYIMVVGGLWLIGRQLGLDAGFGFGEDVTTGADWYNLGLLIASICLLYQYRLIRSRKPAACFQAFLNNQYVGFWIFAGIALCYW